MAKQIVNNGAFAGDPNSEILFDSWEKAKNNFDEIYSSINVHGDVNADSITNEDGFVMKRRGAEWVNSFRKNINSPSLRVITLTVGVDKFDTPINFPRAGTYRLDVSFAYSSDSTTVDFVARATVGGNSVTGIANGEILRIESKDSANDDGDGRGTDQKNIFSCKYYVTVASAGVQNVRLAFNPSGANTEASMWDASIIIEEEFSIITV